MSVYSLMHNGKQDFQTSPMEKSIERVDLLTDLFGGEDDEDVDGF